jgi:hypothetical protein
MWQKWYANYVYNVVSLSPNKLFEYASFVYYL